MQRVGIASACEQALDGPGSRLGVRFPRGLLGKAAVEVLRANQIRARRCERTGVAGSGVHERLQCRPGVIDVAGRAAGSEGEAAVAVLLALDPARRFAYGT